MPVAFPQTSSRHYKLPVVSTGAEERRLKGRAPWIGESRISSQARETHCASGPQEPRTGLDGGRELLVALPTLYAGTTEVGFSLEYDIAWPFNIPIHKKLVMNDPFGHNGLG